MKKLVITKTDNLFFGIITPTHFLWLLLEAIVLRLAIYYPYFISYCLTARNRLAVDEKNILIILL